MTVWMEIVFVYKQQMHLYIHIHTYTQVQIHIQLQSANTMPMIHHISMFVYVYVYPWTCPLIWASLCDIHMQHCDQGTWISCVTSQSISQSASVVTITVITSTTDYWLGWMGFFCAIICSQKCGHLEGYKTVTRSLSCMVWVHKQRLLLQGL